MKQIITDTSIDLLKNPDKETFRLLKNGLIFIITGKVDTVKKTKQNYQVKVITERSNAKNEQVLITSFLFSNINLTENTNYELIGNFFYQKNKNGIFAPTFIITNAVKLENND